jgi:peptidoglycan/LPS O-acetylase OafA/YrhL
MFLDFIRGVSALLVMLGHLRGPLFYNYDSLTNPTYFDKVFYFTTGLGHQAVIVFFVLSGFLVGGSVLNNQSRFKFREYFISRLSRLWTVLIPALLFTFIVDIIYYDSAFAVQASSINSFPTLESYSINLTSFFGNMFFLQTIYFPTFGTNGPLWSLSNEFWYYFLFPILFFSINRKYTQKVNVLLFLVFLVILIWLPVQITILFPLWLLGALLHKTYLKSNFTIFHFTLAFTVFIMILFIARFKIIEGVLSDYMVGISVSLLILTSGAVERLFTPNVVRKFISWLSSISFTLYLFHFPIIVIFAKLLDGERFKPELHGYSTFFIMSLICILTSWFFWFVFERKTYRVKRFFHSLSKNVSKIHVFVTAKITSLMSIK